MNKFFLWSQIYQYLRKRVWSLKKNYFYFFYNVIQLNLVKNQRINFILVYLFFVIIYSNFFFQFSCKKVSESVVILKKKIFWLNIILKHFLSIILLFIAKEKYGQNRWFYIFSHNFFLRSQILTNLPVFMQNCVFNTPVTFKKIYFYFFFKFTPIIFRPKTNYYIFLYNIFLWTDWATNFSVFVLKSLLKSVVISDLKKYIL